MKRNITSIILGICLFSHLGLVFAADTTDLYGKRWVINKILNTEIDASKYPDQKPYLILDASGKYSAYAGCNQIAGTFVLDKDYGLQFVPNAIMTKMACLTPLNFEDSFIGVLPQVRFWVVQLNALDLQDAQHQSLVHLVASS